MVATEHGRPDGVTRFMIRPNRAMSWSGLLRFYSGMVLPFAGLEMLVLGMAPYVVARRDTRYQTNINNIMIGLNLRILGRVVIPHRP